MDWNWFFSSLAQSTAAIVGLFGAFIFSKIINNEQKYKDDNKLIEDFLPGIEHQKQDLKRQFNKLSDIKSKVKEETFYNLFFSSESIDIKNTLIEFGIYTEDPFSKYNEQDISYLENIRNNRKYSLIHAKQLIETAKIHLEIIKTNEESSKFISDSIHYSIILFWFGVILPLLFIPLPSNTFYLSSTITILLFIVKIIILLAVSITFNKIFNNFKKKNEQMKEYKKHKEKIEETVAELSALIDYPSQLKSYEESQPV